MKKDRWIQGYACCLATLIKLDGQVEANSHDLYSGGIGALTEDDLKKAGVVLEDIEVFKEHKLLP